MSTAPFYGLLLLAACLGFAGILLISRIRTRWLRRSAALAFVLAPAVAYSLWGISAGCVIDPVQSEACYEWDFAVLLLVPIQLASTSFALIGYALPRGKASPNGRSA